MTIKRAFLCCALLFLLGLGTCAYEESVEPLTLHSSGTVLLRTHGDLRLFEQVLDRYKLDNDTYPETLQMLTVDDGEGGYIVNVSRDSWNRDYIYRRTESSFELYSAGVNGIDELKLGDDVMLGDKQYQCETYTEACPLTPIAIARIISLFVVVFSFTGMILLLGTKLVLWVMAKRDG